MEATNNSSWVDECIALWQTQGIKIQPGVSKETIAEVGAEIGFQFPPDFVKLYQKVNGFRDFDWNTDMFSVWPMERIADEYYAAKDKDFVSFCDFLISAHRIGFLKDPASPNIVGGIYKHYDLENPIAQTFREAIELINANADVIY